MHRQTKAVDIPPEVRQDVWKRDGYACILCGSPFGVPNAHVIPRSRGGLGVARNVVTLCPACHDRYDNGLGRRETEAEIRAYLRGKYPDWDEGALRYHKYTLPDM